MPRSLIPLVENDPKNKHHAESRIIDEGLGRTELNLPAIARAIGVTPDVMYAVRRGARQIEPPYREKLEKLLAIELPVWVPPEPKRAATAPIVLHGRYTMQRGESGALIITFQMPSEAAMMRLLIP